MKKLLVFVPDSTGRIDPLNPLINLLKAHPKLQDDYWLPLELDLKWWGNKTLSEYSLEINGRIDNYYINHEQTISEIILCGYSLGAMLVRRAYLDAMGYGTPAGQTKRWAAAVNRIVLIGAICRGFNYAQLPPHQWVVMKLTKPLGLANTLRSAFRGESFASNVRVDWITFWSQNRPSHLKVVNVLGTDDDLVKREDGIDIDMDPETASVDIPGNHDTVIIPSQNNSNLLTDAFVGNPSPMTPQIPKRYKPARKVYMLLHGMRSSKQFVMQLAEALKHQEPNALILTPDYGYISIASFLSRSYRLSTVARFVDDYSQCLAVNPLASFYFAGHSNGTCIVGEALRTIPRLKFARLYLGGSALPTTYDWRQVHQRGQVELIRSDRGSKDWAVGIFARALEKLSKRVRSFQGIGSGGYDGFSDHDHSLLVELNFQGGHSDMFGEDKIPSIVEFLTSGRRDMLPQEPVQSPGWFLFLRKYADVVVPVVIALYVGIMIFLLVSSFIQLQYASGDLGIYFGLAMVIITAVLLYRF